MTRSPMRMERGMRPADVLREVLRPITDSVLLIAIATFAGASWLTLLIMQRGPVFVIVGLALGLLVLSTMFRYAIQVLEARAQGIRTPVVDISAMTIFGNLWTLFPLVLTIGFAWAALYLAGTGNTGAATALSVVYALVLPAIIGVLAITHSPLESIKPTAWIRLVQKSGLSYLWIPFVVAALILATGGMARAGAPLLLVVALRIYAIFLTFTLTGEVVRRSGVAGDVSIRSLPPDTDSQYRDALTADRQKVADHAYGFISRGNREGGFKHIRQWIESDPDPDDAVQWFFEEMMRWENTDAALFFGQECLAHFLHHNLDAMALKLMASCIHANPRWRPRGEDRPFALELAEKYARDDLLPSLRG